MPLVFVTLQERHQRNVSRGVLMFSDGVAAEAGSLPRYDSGSFKLTCVTGAPAPAWDYSSLEEEEVRGGALIKCTAVG